MVLSPAAYNGKSGLMWCCPLSTQTKGYPFEVLTQVDGRDGVVRADQLKSLDWKVRKAKKKGTVADGVTRETLAKVKALLGFM